jgi:oligopeptide/dipeptide ABC transporter ATP-binding protein
MSTNALTGTVPEQVPTAGADRSVGGPTDLEVRVRALTVAYRIDGRWLRVVRELDLEARAGETLAVVGETGSGKSSTGHAILRILPSNGRLVSGSVEVAGTDVLALDEKQLRAMRGKRVGYVPQQPMAAFNPTKQIGRQVAEALVVHDRLRYRETLDVVRATLAEMGLDEPDRVMSSFPHQLSGGMLQRAMIAGAIVARPRVLVADEPTSALDVSVQRQILALLRRVRDEHGLTILLITHDLGAVAQIADRVLVLYAGRCVEVGPPAMILSAPRHPYTAGLVDSSPGRGQAHKSRLGALPGAPLGPAQVDSEPGCPFRFRCPQALPICATEFPASTADADHRFFCHNPLPPRQRSGDGLTPGPAQ